LVLGAIKYSHPLLQGVTEEQGSICWPLRAPKLPGFLSPSWKKESRKGIRGSHVLNWKTVKIRSGRKNTIRSNFSFKHHRLQLLCKLQPVATEHTHKTWRNASLRHPLDLDFSSCQVSCMRSLTERKRTVFWQIQVFLFFGFILRLRFRPLTAPEGWDTQSCVRIHVHQHIPACTQALSSTERNGWNLHSTRKTTAKVTPAMPSPTKPAFSRNAAKQKYIFFHCFPMEEFFARHFPILDAGFHQASHILTFN